MKLKVWLDSGANIHSRRERVIDLYDDTGITDEEWAEMSDSEKEEAVKDIAFEDSDWGFKEL